MARKRLTALNLEGNELQNARLQNVAGAPSTPGAGQVWYNSTTGRLEYRGSAATIDPTDRGAHTGVQPVSTIDGFDTAVRTSRLDQLAAPTAPVSLNAQRITNLATPTAAGDACTRGYADAIAASIAGYRLDQFAAPTAPVSFGGQRAVDAATPTSASDLATKGYVDNLSNGTDWKESARVATTANIALTGTQTIDGVANLALNDRVLVKNQVTGTENGLYLYNPGGAWTRTADADADSLTAGMAVMITEGTTNGDSQWRLTTNDPITVDQTVLTFTQIGAATSYSGGTGIVITGNAIAIDTASVARKYATTFGDGSATVYTITHGLGSDDTTVSVRELSTKDEVDCDVNHATPNTIVLSFALPPALNSLRVAITG
jgi:hypothetical protein